LLLTGHHDLGQCSWLSCCAQCNTGRKQFSTATDHRCCAYRTAITHSSRYVHVYISGATILKITLHHQAQSLLASLSTCRGCMILCDSTGPSSWYAWLCMHPRNSQHEAKHFVDRPGRQTCKPPMLCSISLYVLPCCCVRKPLIILTIAWFGSAAHCSGAGPVCRCTEPVILSCGNSW
jgi:hypothetical protein